MSTYDDTDEQILDAAEATFAEHGFHETVVAEVAEKAGVGKGTVYRRFGNKTDLFSELICEGTNDLIDELQRRLEPKESFKERLRTIVAIHFELFDKSGELVGITVQEGLSKFGEWQDDVINRWQEYRDLLTQFFDDEISSGRLATDLSAEECSKLLTNMIWGTIRSCVIFEEDSPRDQHESILITTFIRGIARSE